MVKKEVYCCLLALILLFAAQVQAKPKAQEQPIRLIVNAADAGLLHSINLGIEKCYKEGVLTTAAVIVPGPWFHHFAKFARENPSLHVGIHLAVASGLYPYPCKPISPWSKVRSIVDHQGFMFDNIKDFQANNPTFEHIKKELKAQIELAYMEGIDIAFLDNHIGNTEDIRRAIKELAEEFGLPTKGGNGEIDVMDLYMTPPDEAPAKMAELIDKNITGPGVYLSRHHPAWMTQEIKNLVAGNMPYAEGEFAAYRYGEAKAIVSEEVKKVIKRRDIQLIGFYREKRDEIRSRMHREKREAILKRIKGLKKFKYAIPKEPYVFEGTPAVIARTEHEIKIDGSLKDFKKAVPILMDGSNPKNVMSRKNGAWGGKKDLSADVRILYDDKNIYVGLKVTDDRSPVNNNPDYDINKGDCFELYLNTDPEITYIMRGMVKKDKNDCKFTLAPTSKNGKSVVLCQGKGVVSDKVKIACKILKDGYTIEAAIPQSLIDKDDWKVGDRLRFDAAITDMDEAGKLKSKIWWHAQNKKAWQNPNYWGVAQIK